MKYRYNLAALFFFVLTASRVMSEETTKQESDVYFLDKEKQQQREPRAETAFVTVTIHPSVYFGKQKFRIDPVINHSSLHSIKEFILKYGDYHAFYYTLPPYQFTLSPDPVHINSSKMSSRSDMQKYEYNRLNVRPSEYKLCSTPNTGTQFEIDFKDKPSIHINVNWPSDDLSVGIIRRRAEEAITAMLEEIKKKEEASKKEVENAGKM